MQHRVSALLALFLLLSLLPSSPVRGEEIVVTASPLAGETPAALAQAIYACEYERPVAALAAMLEGGHLGMATHPA